MTKRKPKHRPPDFFGAADLSQLGASKADAKHRLAAIDIAAEHTKRRHALLARLDAISTSAALDEAESRIADREKDERPFKVWPDYEPAPANVPHDVERGDSWNEKPLANPVHERMDLVPWDGVLAVARTMTDGVRTHDEGAWRKLSQREHISRAMRHLALFLVGDSAAPHLEHACCRILMALDQWPQAQEGKPDVY